MPIASLMKSGPRSDLYGKGRDPSSMKATPFLKKERPSPIVRIECRNPIVYRPYGVERLPNQAAKTSEKSFLLKLGLLLVLALTSLCVFKISFNISYFASQL
jgi:hypothetical protein